MTFPNPFPTKTADISVIPAAEVNAAGVSISRSVDGAGGGLYTPSSVIEIDGQGIKSDNIGDSTFTGIQTFSSQVDFNGNPTNIKSTTAITCNGTFNMTGAVSRFTWRLDTATLGDSVEDVDCSFDEYHLAATLTANRVYTLRHTGAFELPTGGERIRIRLNSTPGAFALAVKREDATSLATLNGVAGIAYAEFVYTGSEWRTSAWGPNTINVNA